MQRVNTYMYLLAFIWNAILMIIYSFIKMLKRMVDIWSSYKWIESEHIIEGLVPGLVLTLARLVSYIFTFNP